MTYNPKEFDSNFMDHNQKTTKRRVIHESDQTRDMLDLVGDTSDSSSNISPTLDPPKQHIKVEKMKI